MQRLMWSCAVASCLAMLSAHAQMTPPPATAVDPALAELKAGRDKIAADYKADRTTCDAMKNNAKDVCIEEAKGKEKVARAELDQQLKPSDGNARKVAQAKVDAAYSIAKEKCGDQKGDAKSACVKQAKAEEEKGNAVVKAMKN